MLLVTPLVTVPLLIMPFLQLDYLLTICYYTLTPSKSLLPSTLDTILWALPRRHRSSCGQKDTTYQATIIGQTQSPPPCHALDMCVVALSFFGYPAPPTELRRLLVGCPWICSQLCNQCSYPKNIKWPNYPPYILLGLFIYSILTYSPPMPCHACCLTPCVGPRNLIGDATWACLTS